jgi:hypothetical protein
MKRGRKTEGKRKEGQKRAIEERARKIYFLFKSGKWHKGKRLKKRRHNSFCSKIERGINKKSTKERTW